MSSIYCSCKKRTNERKISCTAKDAATQCPGNGMFHLSCINLTYYESLNIDQYVCSSCSVRTGEKTIWFEEESEEEEVLASFAMINSHKELMAEADKSNVENIPPTDHTNTEQDCGGTCQSDNSQNENRPINNSQIVGELPELEIATLPETENESRLQTTEIAEQNASTDCQTNTAEEQLPDIEMAQEPDEDDGEFMVEKIVGWGYNDDEQTEGTMLYFHIKWQGFPESENTWISEDNLQSAYDIVVEYRRKQKLGPTPLTPHAGADLSCNKKFNKLNWVTPQQIQETLDQLLKHPRYSTELERIITLKRIPRPKKDTIIILVTESHCYAILWIAKEKRGFISDGANLSMNSETIKRISLMMNLKLTGVRVLKSMKIDYCATAAILACLEYSRVYKNYNWEELEALEFPQHLYNRVKSKLHPAPSQASKNWIPIQQRNLVLRCTHCGYNTRKGRQSLMLHVRQCKNK